MSKNELVSAAVMRSKELSKRGLLDRMFALMFRGMVYPQIWEDPEVDLTALRLTPDSRILTIASGGCNVFNYLTESPADIVAVDLNPHHIALGRLKKTALGELPSYESFFRFFGYADEKGNVRAFKKHLLTRLDPITRDYWMSRGVRGLRINLFARNIYRYGVLGRFIGLLHFVAKLTGRNPNRLLTARNMDEQRWLFETLIEPIFETRALKALCRLPVSYFGLGIPPAQFESLTASSGGNMAGLMRDRLERLACGFPMADNYFAWQAFGRGYDKDKRVAVPRYLEERHYDLLRSQLDKVRFEQTSVTDYLRTQENQSLDRYVLLDAQDWMSDELLVELWEEILRTAKPGTRVIFRTAGEETILPGRVPDEILKRFRYDPEESKAMGARDRSSIYGGFHLYELTDPLVA
jgi:S-adenosylmethionine-diacylglycerol 3-amino-3-carboxypropyl transferase